MGVHHREKKGGWRHSSHFTDGEIGFAQGLTVSMELVLGPRPADSGAKVLFSAPAASVAMPLPWEVPKEETHCSSVEGSVS